MPNRKITKTLNESNYSSLCLTYTLHLIDISYTYIPQKIIYMHFPCLSEVNIGMMLDWGYLLRTNYVFIFKCYIYNTSIMRTKRHILKTSFRFILDLLVKPRIGTLSYWGSINRSSKMFSKNIENV